MHHIIRIYAQNLKTQNHLKCNTSGIPSVLAVVSIILILFSACGTNNHVNTTPLFWEISSDQNIIYALGSIHVAKEEIYPLSKTIMDAYDNSSCVVFERDITSEQVSTPDRNIALSQIIDTDLYEQVFTRIKELYPSFPDEEIHSSSFYGIVELLMKTCYTEAKLSPENSIDIYFMNRALTDGKLVSGVESYAQAAEDLTHFPDAYYEYTLKALLDSKTYVDNVSLLFKDWCRGDLTAIESTQVQPLREAKDNSELERFLYEFSLVERNSRITETFIDYLESNQTTFFVIGVAHLVGDEGVISQLEKSGYEIRLLDIT